MTVGATSACLQDGTPGAVVVPARLRGTTAERLLSTLTAAADREGLIEATLTQLADALGTSRRQVRRSARDLESAELLRVVRPAQASGPYTPTLWAVPLAGAQLVLVPGGAGR